MQTMKNRSQFVVCLLSILVTCRVTPAPGQSLPEEGVQQFADFGDFKLQSGSVIRDFRLGYRTLGRLNADRSNAVLWPTWLGSKSEDLLQFIGTGKVVDTSNYYVVLVDAIGNGVSVSPSNSKRQALLKFPRFTIRDMVESEHRLAIEVLHLSHLRAVMGVSMGGMQTFEWAAAYPDFMDIAIPMAGSPQSTSFDKLLWTAQIDAVELDPAWNRGNPTGPLTLGFAVSEEIGQMNLNSPAYRVAHTTPKDFEAYLAELKKHAVGDGGLASNQIRQRQAIISLDIPGELGVTLPQAAKRVRARLLVIISQQDHMVNPIPAREFAGASAAPILTLDSRCGHISLDCISFGPTAPKFLADPASVRTETLHDPSNR